MEYIAHTAPEKGDEQPLIEHLINTAEAAREFAAPFGAEAAAYRCGLLHDIGKYSLAFQKRIRGANIRVDHSTAGAVEAFALRDGAAALCIAGHHGGIPDLGNRTDSSGTLLARVRSRGGKEIEDYSAFREELTAPPAKTPARFAASKEGGFFYAHMLYSCLVDADWLDTERFMSAGGVERGTGEALGELCIKLDAYVSRWWAAAAPINVRRCAILRELMKAGKRRKGLYTLTVPTGGGKTVGSMAFALRHALENAQRRIIYVIPYTSIIEQTQAVFEEIFGAENVVAHYANVEYDSDENGDMSARDRRRYLASENWDAPVILTTAVQFFESLFGNRPSCCRKLHNIAGSVIIFDEAQMLPVNYLTPCVWAIAELVKNYGCTAVLCTATQPSLGRLIKKYLPGDIEELCPDIDGNHSFFQRVRFRRDGRLSDDTLAARISDEPAALCIVNNRRQAQQIFALLPEEGRFHLSTAMTAAHRRETLDEIRGRLKAGETCRVVSTSLIEAGVDVDFPTVYKAVAGLDSIIQAGGRCNREGRHPAEESIVHIFDTEARPPRALAQNTAAARRVIEACEDISSPAAIETYFDFLLYTLKNDSALDEKNVMREIGENMAFDTVARNFHLIDDNAMTVYIPLGEGRELVDRLRFGGPSRELLRKLGQFAVSVNRRDYEKLDSAGAVEQMSGNTAVLLDTAQYNGCTGLNLSPEGGQAEFQ